MLYLGFCLLNCDSFHLVPVQSRSFPAVLLSDLDGVKSGHALRVRPMDCWRGPSGRLSSQCGGPVRLSTYGGGS
jgi:hypothetical protein